MIRSLCRLSTLNCTVIGATASATVCAAWVAFCLAPSSRGQDDADNIRQTSGSDSQYPADWPTSNGAARSASAGPTILESAQIIAVVGNEPILAGELLSVVNPLIDEKLKGAPADIVEEQREKLMKQLLTMVIDTKLLYLEFLGQVPPGNLKELHANLDEHFNKTQLDSLMEQANVSTAGELDAVLRSYGTSLKKRRQQFGEQMLAQQMLRQHVDFQPEITHDEAVEYYREHAADYDVPARARWEHLMVRVSNYADKGEAYRALAEMGNDVMSGTPLAEVARRNSQGVRADDGGLNDWTTQGSLVSRVLDEAIFTLPIGKLSRILEDEQGFHIVRVVEREEATRVPFIDAQVEIRKALTKNKVEEQRKEYLEQVREQTPVWTIYDDKNAAAPRP